MNIDILNAKGKKAGSIELPSEIFDVDPNIPLMHQVVVAQLAAARQGTHSTKTRGQVRGGGKKPWRQKGTGRARHGSIRSPQWRGGGVVFGPQPRSYKQRTPKKMKAAALRCALSDRARHDRIFAVEAFIEAEKPSTKVARKFLEGITENKKVLVVVDNFDSIDVLSLRNLPQVKLLTWGNLNTYDVLDADDVIFVKEALTAFIEARTGEEAKITTGAAKKAAAKKSSDKPAAKKAPAKKASTKKADDDKATAKKAKDSQADEGKAKSSDLKEKAEKKAEKADKKSNAKADDAKDEEASK